MYSDGFVVVGASYAGVSFALQARKLGYTGPITIFTDETDVAYDVPYLSKTYLTPGASREVPVFKSPALLARQAITLRAGVKVASIARVDRSIRLETGERVPFDYLILATGAEPVIPVPFRGLDHVVTLKTLADARAIAARLAGVTRLAVIGGGVLGVETAHALRARGLDVTLYERAPRLMARQVSAELAGLIADRLRAAGITLRLGAEIGAVTGRAEGITLDGADFDLALVSAGSQPNIALAQSARIPTGRGVLVDAYFRTGDNQVFAVGDCLEPEGPSTFRLNGQSVQHGTETGKQAAEGLILDRPARPLVPTFWSALGKTMIRMAGYYDPDRPVQQIPTETGWCAVQGDPAAPDFVEALEANLAYMALLPAVRV